MRTNIHATAIAIGDRGVLLLGPSGSGKTGFALHAIGAARLEGRHACLVADDQVFLERAGTRIVVSAPPSIAGLAELRGVGPVAVSHLAAAVLDLAVRLVPQEQAPRLPEPAIEVLSVGEVPLLLLPSWRNDLNWLALRAVLNGAAGIDGRLSPAAAG